MIWTKFPLQDSSSDPATSAADNDDSLTPHLRSLIEDYVNKKFKQRTPAAEENVVWFKNFARLKSIHALEHFHVMLYDPDPGFMREVTGGDVPMSQRERVGKGV